MLEASVEGFPLAKSLKEGLSSFASSSGGIDYFPVFFTDCSHWSGYFVDNINKQKNWHQNELLTIAKRMGVHDIK